MTSHEAELRKRSKAYRRAEDQLAVRREELAAAVRAAYTDRVRKADIERWAGHVWTGTWINNILKGVKQKPKTTEEPTDG
ncbi:hypothetical protein [Micromonospora craterilacus]|uniref:hypothetical protein n=1 Tax=Micromonospora craterilacus TaxID=1655439 RepID=UPI0011B6731D|nr:hypothetical protein [Micromonospora craterilacus]